jgi:tRNA-Thr(GGU) m(6)t(6)A37 methyltransferase TsaA
MWRHGANVPPEAIGFVDSPYKDTAAIPKGLGAKHDAEGILRILPEFEVGFTDFEGFSHLIGSRHSTAPRLRSAWHTPPATIDQHGLFATRSPRRPNPIGVCAVGAITHVRGVNMLDGTPTLDIKPYLSSVPSETLRREWLAEAELREG